MKKLLQWTVIIACAALAISCATAPAKPPAGAAPEAELQKARDLQKQVDAYGLGDYAPQDYKAAVQDLKDGEGTYGKDNAASKASLVKAIAEFQAVIDKGGPLYLAKLKAQCDASKKAADDAKAPVAVKADYAKALDAYNRANTEAAAKDIGGALKDYTTARDGFDAAAKLALEKRQKALQAMKETDQGLAESGQKATDAEQQLKDEGFEAPSAQ
jgi:hypothetical protein